MPVTISDRTMTSDRSPHAARLAPGTQDHWEVSWLPGRRLTRNEAITAMTLAETCSTTAAPDPDRQWPFIEGWAAELGITTGHAITRISAVPAWTATPETEPERPDPEAGE
ncbi:hypothetical protein EAS64_38555 [Trebonia kvetii]|uniref:Uncharacterized protein n=1 Tax=Trebonia kvetii TaxID=2480626 RepID=A0A6P2BLV2_9ACTN|nr:hypothetical protein [Trebonia kvetii]TVY99993.1 hypothetical protein EAS64_38555 [Trebonia kvetii]